VLQTRVRATSPRDVDWSAILGFAIASFAVAWAWINYSWFASAYDTDDWVMRLATMAQMIGVIVLALGLEQMFASIDEGGGANDNRVMPRASDDAGTGRDRPQHCDPVCDLHRSAVRPLRLVH